MSINLDNLIINRALSGSMIDKEEGEALYSLNQITEPSLEITGETAEVVDAVGTRVASFDRSKAATLSGSNAFINLGLAAAQFGSEKTVADDSHPIVVPVREVLTVDDGLKITLTDTPATDYLNEMAVSAMTQDGGLTTAFSSSISDAAGKYVLSGSNKILTFHTGDVVAGDKITVLYKKQSTSAVQIENRADCFTKGGEFWLEVLFCDPCNTNVEYHGFVVFPNAKMTNETTIDFNNEATHGFTIEANQDYCDDNRKLFYIVVSE